MSLTKIRALSLLDIGKSKTYVCKLLKIKHKKLNKWILEDSRSSKDRVILLNFLGYSKKEICSVFFLSPKVFDDWTEEALYDIEEYALDREIIYSNDTKLLEQNDFIPKQNGFSNWVNNIFDQTKNITSNLKYLKYLDNKEA